MNNHIFIMLINQSVSTVLVYECFTEGTRVRGDDLGEATREPEVC